MSNIDAQMMELMLRAPLCPDWFQPPEAQRVDVTHSPQQSAEAYLAWRAREKARIENRISEWPSYYAKKVMEAASK